MRMITFGTHSIIFLWIFRLICNLLGLWTLRWKDFRRWFFKYLIWNIVWAEFILNWTYFPSLDIISFSLKSSNRTSPLERLISFLCKSIEWILEMICSKLTDRIVIQKIFLWRIFIIKIVLKIWYSSDCIIVGRLPRYWIHLFFKNLLLQREMVSRSPRFIILTSLHYRLHILMNRNSLHWILTHFPTNKIWRSASLFTIKSFNFILFLNVSCALKGLRWANPFERLLWFIFN